jgi:hypothetical protein
MLREEIQEFPAQLSRVIELKTFEFITFTLANEMG